MIVSQITPCINDIMNREDPNRSNASSDTNVLRSLNDLYFTYQLPAIVFTSLMLLLGLPGNMLVFYIYFFKWRRSTSRIFILFLAALDMANCAINMPMEIYIMRFSLIFSLPVLCKISRYSSYVMNSASAIILVAIAMDRYRRICRPYKKTFSNAQSKYACIGAVLFSILSTWPALVLYGVRKIKIRTIEIQTCLLENKYDATVYPMMFIIYMSTMTLVIFTVLTVLYYFVGLQIYRHRTFKMRRCSHVEKVVDDQSPTPSKTRSNSEHVQNIGNGNLNRSCNIEKYQEQIRGVKNNNPIRTRHSIDCGSSNQQIGLLETNIDDVIGFAGKDGDCKPEDKEVPVTSDEASIQHDTKEDIVRKSARLNIVENTGCPRKDQPSTTKCTDNDTDTCNRHRVRGQRRRRVRYMLVRNYSTITRSRAARCISCMTIRVGRSTYMLFLITIAYVISFLPFYTILLIRQFDMTFLERVLESKASYMAYFLIIRSYLFSSAINPFIYSFCNAQFRKKCIKAITVMFLRSDSVNDVTSRRRRV